MKPLFRFAAVLLIIHFAAALAAAMDDAGDPELDAVYAHTGLAIEFRHHKMHALGYSRLHEYRHERPRLADVWPYRGGIAVTFNDFKEHEYRGGLEIWWRPEGPDVGFIYAEGAQRTIHVNAVRFGCPDSDRPLGMYSKGTDLKANYPEALFENIDNLEFRPLTVRIKENLPLMSAITDSDRDMFGIAIGLPTIETYVTEDSRDQLDIIMTTGDPPETRLDREEIRERDDIASFGTIHARQGAMTVLGGRVEIMPLEEYKAAGGI